MKRRAAFTMIEMVIVLGLVTLVVCLTGPQMKRSQQCVAEQEFWHSFRQEWHCAQTQAQLSRQSTIITYEVDENAIVFKNHQYRHLVTLPNSLQVRKFRPLEMRADGYLEPGSRRFYSRAQHCWYRLVIQMARGEFDVKKE
ncbi:type II secretion system protein [Limosilactobacillus sp.]|uniref:type II secretion system protein n=1 Tax=Limosilactobacillus sp. TaxID=2773925 RepID=UPI003EFC5FE2